MIDTFIKPFELKGMEYFHRFEYQTGHEFEGHTHKSIEMNVIFKGIMQITCGSSVLTAKAGDLVLIQPEVFHKNRVISVETCDMLAMHFFTDDLKFTKEQYQYKIDEECIALVHMFVEEVQEHCNTDFWGASGEMTSAAKKLLEVLMLKVQRIENRPEFSPDTDSLVYHKAVRFMLENLNRNLSVREIALEAGVCETILKRAFTKYTGGGVNKYFTQLRIDKAKEMLANGMKCMDVSEQLGFSSQAYFSRCFKKNCGVSPSR